MFHKNKDLIFHYFLKILKYYMALLIVIGIYQVSLVLLFRLLFLLSLLKQVVSTYHDLLTVV